MPLPSSGTITLTQIQTEFGGSAPTNLTEYYRGGAYVTSNNTNVPTSGAIGLTNFYGATRQFAFTISSNQVNANLRALAVSAGWDQSAPLVATVASGVYINSNNTGVPALTVNGSFPAGVQLVNNGVIVGMGGAGGSGDLGSSLRNGSAGGTAIAASVAISVTNNGSVAGGGGGGGGGAVRGQKGFNPYQYNPDEYSGGGGGGGGRCGVGVSSAGGAGGTGTSVTYNGGAGASGSIVAAGGGGYGGSSIYGLGGAGGSGGDVGTAGSDGGAGSGGNYVFANAGSGGAAGAAASGNSNITWLVAGTRLGPLV